MNYAEKIAIPIGSKIEYKRNGYVGSCTGTLEARYEMRGRQWIAVRPEGGGRMRRMLLSRVLRVVEARTVTP